MDARQLYARAAIIKALAAAISDAETEAKAALAEVMDPGDKKRAMLDGENVGTISYTESRAKAVVTDYKAFARWVAETAPTEVTFHVTVDARDLMDVLDPLGATPPDQASNEDYGTIGRLLAAAQRAVQNPQVNTAYADAVLKEAVKTGGVIDTDTGELLDFVKILPAGAGSIQVRLTDTQKQNIADAIAAGKVTLPDVVTPLAIEGRGDE